MATSGHTTNFKGKSLNLIGPRLKSGDRAPARAGRRNASALGSATIAGGADRAGRPPSHRARLGPS